MAYVRKWVLKTGKCTDCRKIGIFLRNNSREVVFVAGYGRNQVLALEQALEVEVIEKIFRGALNDGSVGGDSVKFGNGAVDHGGDDV
jgi:hypothetical protein